LIALREASHLDLGYVESMLKWCIDEGALFLADGGYSPERGARSLTRILQDPGALRIVWEVDDKVAGCLLATIADHPWCETRFTNVDLMYVKPELRRAPIFDRMINLLEGYAEMNGAVPLLQITSGLNLERMHKLMNRKGYTHAGGTLLKRGVEHGHASH